MEKFSLAKKLVYIIGGSGQLGKEIVKTFAEANAKIILLDIKEEFAKNFKKKYLSKIKYHYFDCTNKNYDNDFNEIIKKNGVPNIFINCSYPMTKKWKESSFKKITRKNLEENINIHLNTYAWLAKTIADKMKTKKIRGSIIQFGSIYGILGQDLSIYLNTKMEENMSYSIIKGGITNLTRQMASYYGKFNIRVNTICPGGIKGTVQGVMNKQEKNFVQNYSLKVPLSRLGNADEISYPVLFLASEASSYITGSTLVVDGGWSII